MCCQTNKTDHQRHGNIGKKENLRRKTIDNLAMMVEKKLEIKYHSQIKNVHNEAKGVNVRKKRQV